MMGGRAGMITAVNKRKRDKARDDDKTLKGDLPRRIKTLEEKVEARENKMLQRYGLEKIE